MVLIVVRVGNAWLLPLATYVDYVVYPSINMVWAEALRTNMYMVVHPRLASIRPRVRCLYTHVSYTWA